MKIKFNNKLIIVGLICSTLLACVDDDKGDDVNKDVDQLSFLSNSSSLINSSYQAFNQSVIELETRINELEANTNQANLDRAQLALKKAYKAFQTVSFYEFGPAETVSLKSALNIFKTDTAQIEANINSGNYNLDQIAMKDAKGFPALDYLLNAKTDTSIQMSLKSQKNRCLYLKAVAEDIRLKVGTVANDWNSYKNDYAANEGTDVGSSTGMLINALNQHYEKYFRDNKIGIPVGVRSSGIARPDFAEAFYGAYSVELAVENFNAMKKLYEGNGGYGLDDYLIASDADDLNNTIVNQMQVIDLKLKALSDPLPEQISSNSNQVMEVYNEIQKLIVLWKVDMPSRMGVLITYQDNDGD